MCKKCQYKFDMDDDPPYCPACDCEDLEILENETCEFVEIHEHHLHPRFMDNKEGNGEKVRISKKRHHILHGKIMGWLWKEIKKEDKENVIKKIIELSKLFVGDDNGNS